MTLWLEQASFESIPGKYPFQISEWSHGKLSVRVDEHKRAQQRRVGGGPNRCAELLTVALNYRYATFTSRTTRKLSS
jgi:hypothetical protein